jgi:hypothetical protein
MIVHPSLTDRFREVEPELESTWRDIRSPAGFGPDPDRPTYANRTLCLHPEHAESYRRLLAGWPATKDLVRAQIRGWVDYASKLERRHADGADTFTVLPTVK